MESSRKKNIHQTDSVTLETYTNFEELEPIQSQWDQFVEDVCGDIFMTYDWCRIWWKYYGKNRNLKIFVFRSDDELVGIAPLFFEKIWLGPVSVRAAKIVGSDFTLFQFSLPIRDCFFKEVIAKLSDKLRCQDCDIIHLGPIAGLYNNFEQIEGVLRSCFGKSHSIEVCSNGVQIFVELSGDWEGQIRNLSANQKRSFRQSYKIITNIETGKKMSLVCNQASKKDFEEIYNGFVQMHQLHWQRLNKGGHFTDWPTSMEFHREAAIAQMERNRLRLVEVKLGGHSLAYQYNYKFGDRFFAFLNALPNVDDLVDICPKVSIGRILFGEVAKKAMEENVKYIDMMRGDDGYKLRLGGKPYNAKSFFIIQNKFTVRVRVCIFRGLAKLLNICYYKIWYVRVAPKILKKHRPLNKLWIRTKAFAK